MNTIIIMLRIAYVFSINETRHSKTKVIMLSIAYTFLQNYTMKAEY